LQSSTFANAYSSGGYVINDPSVPYNFDEVPKTGELTGIAYSPFPDTRTGAEILLGYEPVGFALDFLDNSSAVRTE
jgi:hypothetical protein